MKKGKVVVNRDRCKGCELCITSCPKGVLGLDPHEVNAQGYHPVCVVEEEACIACASCALMCPDGVLSVYEV